MTARVVSSMTDWSRSAARLMMADRVATGRACQRGAAFPSMPLVGKNMPHDPAVGHVSGESVYIDDVSPLRGELIVDFVWSPISDVRGSADYRLQLAENIMAKFWYDMMAAPPPIRDAQRPKARNRKSSSR